MKCLGPTLSTEEIKQYREQFEFNPELEELAEFYNVLANPLRVKILHILKAHGSVCVCDLRDILGVSISAVSQHLAKLKAYKIVRSEKDAQVVFYSLVDHPLLNQAVFTKEKEV